MEIERKFLLKNDSWRKDIKDSIKIKQGYISTEPTHTVRIRITENKAWLTFKGKNEGIKREEFEFLIPYEKAEKMFEVFCEQNQISKIRHIVMHMNNKWEIDEFKENLEGLIIAELELSTEDEKFEKPLWLGEEVSDDPRYYNSNLAKETR